MRIGILSDSHGRHEITRRAVSMLRDAGADMLLHLGDFENESVIDELVGFDARIVFGNCDYDESAMTRYAESLGITVNHPCGRLTIAGKTILFTHGHLEQDVARAMDEQPDYMLHGHTHELRDERIGATRIINPGALFRAVRYTVALLDPATDRLTILDVGKDSKPARP
jgi:uncharacterized protein